MKALWWAALVLMMPVRVMAEACPPYSIGVHQQKNVSISVARSEILDLEEPASIAIAKSESKIKARKQLTKQKSATIHGAVDISTCQADEFIYASVTQSNTTRQQANNITSDVAKSVESQPTLKSQRK